MPPSLSLGAACSLSAPPALSLSPALSVPAALSAARSVPAARGGANSGPAVAGRFGEYVWRITQFYKAFHQRTVGMDGIYLHDPTALVAAFKPELFTWQDGKARCCAGPESGS